jgi:hypothetical protein
VKKIIIYLLFFIPFLSISQSTDKKETRKEKAARERPVSLFLSHIIKIPFISYSSFPQISEKVWKDKAHKQNDIIKSLADADPAVRGDAAVAIAAIGPGAAAAVPSLVKMLGDEAAPAARYPAAFALGRIGPAAKPAVEQLRALAMSPSSLPKWTPLAPTSKAKLTSSLTMKVTPCWRHSWASADAVSR